MGRQSVKNPVCQDVATLGPPVAQNPVEEEVISGIVMNTKKWGIAFLEKWDFSFTEPDMGCQGPKPDILIDPAGLIEHSLPQPVKAESSATLPVYRLGDTALLSFDDFSQTR